MSRRPDPKRIDDARRAALHARLGSSGMTDELADEWIARWESRAIDEGRQRDAQFWRIGWEWITAQRR